MTDTTAKAPPSERQIAEAITRLRNKLAGHAMLLEPIRGFTPQMTIDLRLIVTTAEGQMNELRQIDMALARRDALDDLATRPQKIQKAIDVASTADARQKHLLDIYKMLGVEWGVEPFTRIKYLRKYDPAERYVPVTESVKGHTFRDVEQRERFLDKERLCTCGHSKGAHYNFEDHCMDGDCECLAFIAIEETPTSDSSSLEEPLTELR